MEFCYFYELACKDTNLFSYTQVRAQFYEEKTRISAKNENFLLFIFYFQDFVVLLCRFCLKMA